MATKSSMVSNRNANADFVISSVNVHGGAVAESLLAHNAGLPKQARLGKQELESLMHWMVAILQQKNRTLDTAEMAYVKEQADEPAVMARRDELFEVLVDAVTRVRGRIDSILGPTGLRTYGMSNAVPRTPQEASEYARVAARLMRAHAQTVHDDIGGTLDTEQLAGVLDAQRQPLDEAMAELTQERRERTAAMLQRNQALDEWATIYQGVASTLAGLYRMAGHDELAQRIRPTARRARGNEGAPRQDDALPAIPDEPGAVDLPVAPPADALPEGAVSEGVLLVAEPGQGA